MAAKQTDMEDSLDHLQGLIHEVEMDWRQVMAPSANPLDIALPLLDNTSVGLAHRRGEFNELKDNIEDGLREAVKQNYEAFNESVGSYRDVVNFVANSRSVVSAIQDRVEQIEHRERGDIAAMTSLNENFKVYNEMIEILTIIESIKKTPHELESVLAEKNYGKAESILHTIEESAQKYNLWELPALKNMRDYFQTQREQLFGILVEEVVHTIFSKRQFSSFNTVNNLLKSSANALEHSNIEQFLANSIETDITQASSINHTEVENFINNLSLDPSSLDSDQRGADDISTLDDSNPFNQILQLMLIVAKLGKLAQMVDIILRRFSTELNLLINRITEDTKIKHAKLIKVLNSNDVGPRVAQENFSGVVLQDLFWNCFKKSLFLLQSIRIMTEIHMKFEDIHFDASQATVATVLERFWAIIHKELNSVILSYITDTHSGAINSKLTNTTSLTKGKQNIFSLYKVEYDKAQTMQLKVALQDLFPGFINTQDTSYIDSPYIEDNKFLKQSKIVQPDVLNMRFMLEPFLLFIEGSSLLFTNQNSNIPLKFFTEVMHDEFLPLLEDRIVDLYSDAVDGIEPLSFFEPETKIDVLMGEAEEPEIKRFAIFIEFKQFMNRLLFNLNASLQFREEFIPVLFKVFTMFHDKIEDLYKELFTDLVSFLEPNRDLINAIRNKERVTQAMLGKVDVVDLKNSKIRTYFKIYRSSLDLLIDWFDHYLIRTIDLNKTDLNVTQVEKLRKTWFFFQFQSMTSNNNQGDDPLDLEHSCKLILNDELRLKFNNEVVLEYKKLQADVMEVLRVCYQAVHL